MKVGDNKLRAGKDVRGPASFDELGEQVRWE